MAKKFWQTRQFKKLQKHWYKKIADDGFEDIEGTDPSKQMYNDTPYLKQHWLHAAQVCIRGTETLGAHYFRMASGWLYHGEFDSEWDRYIWEQHAEGYSEREIVKVLERQDVFPRVSRFPINGTIAKVKSQMMESVWFNNYENDGYLCPYSYGMSIREL